MRSNMEENLGYHLEYLDDGRDPVSLHSLDPLGVIIDRPRLVPALTYVSHVAPLGLQGTGQVRYK